MEQFNEEHLENLRITLGSVLTPDLLRRDWLARQENEHHTHGHCYVAAEALFHLLGGWDSEWRSWVGFEDNDTHWWLVSNRRNNRILDPTKEQYTCSNPPVEPPYSTGRKNTFLTKQPSKRARIVMDRVKSIFPKSIL